MKNPSSKNGFYNNFDKYDKICYKGMEQHFYLRESMGPGAYMTQDFIHESKTKMASKYSVPKKNRGLLTKGKHTSPGPMEYKPDKLFVKPKES